VRVVSVHEVAKGRKDGAIGWGETQGEKEGRKEEEIDV
jgi:hypothetical protein